MNWVITSIIILFLWTIQLYLFDDFWKRLDDYIFTKAVNFCFLIFIIVALFLATLLSVGVVIDGFDCLVDETKYNYTLINEFEKPEKLIISYNNEARYESTDPYLITNYKNNLLFERYLVKAHYSTNWYGDVHIQPTLIISAR